MAETEVKETEEVEEKVDGRTTEGKMLARLDALENTQAEILKTLLGHGNKIAECSIRR